MSKQVDLMIVAEGSQGGIARRHRCDSKQQFEVRDLSTRSVIQLRAEEISLYRHTLLMNGIAYRILNIFKLA